MTADNQDSRPPAAGGGRGTEHPSGGGSAGRYAGVGLQLLVLIIAGLYGGQWLDRRFGTKGILTVVGVLVGAGLAIFSVYRQLVADQRRDEAARRR